MNRTTTPRVLIAVVAAALSLLVVVSALAAHPKAGKTYTGFISAPPNNGHKPPVSFKVSRDGKRLLGFKWAGFGCVGGGGPGNPWTNPYNNYKVGTLKVSKSGTFSVKNVKSTQHQHGAPTKITFSSVSGRFRTAKKAAGTIRVTQKIQGHTCSGKKQAFTVTAR